VGVLPGLGPGAAIALLPARDLITSIPFRPASCWQGFTTEAMYGGSTTSILVNIPGEVCVGRYVPRRTSDGIEGEGGSGAGDRGVRVLHCGDICGYCPDVRGPACWQELPLNAPEYLCGNDDRGEARADGGPMIDRQYENPRGMPGTREAASMLKEMAKTTDVTPLRPSRRLLSQQAGHVRRNRPQNTSTTAPRKTTRQCA